MSEATPFDIAGDMEDGVLTVRDLGRAVAMMAESLTPEEGCAVSRVGWAIVEAAQELEKQRVELWRMLNRKRAAGAVDDGNGEVEEAARDV